MLPQWQDADASCEFHACAAWVVPVALAGEPGVSKPRYSGLNTGPSLASGVLGRLWHMLLGGSVLL
jgi:hypothetical protein